MKCLLWRDPIDFNYYAIGTKSRPNSNGHTRIYKQIDLYADAIADCFGKEIHDHLSALEDSDFPIEMNLAMTVEN